MTEVTDDSIVVSHPSGHRQQLEFSKIVAGPKNGPAVFMIESGTLLYIILQFISYKTNRSGLSRYSQRFDRSAYNELFSDQIIKRGLMEQWCKFFKTFSERGWGYKSLKRFALRAGIKTDTIRAFRNEAWEEIDALPDDVLMAMAKQVELLPTFLDLSCLIQHDFARVIAK